MNNKNSPDGIVDTFYARDYDNAYDMFLRKHGKDINSLDVRIKQPWFDVIDPNDNVVATFRASDIDQAQDKAKSDHDDWTDDDWNIYRRPDNAPEPEKKLSARAQVAKRIKEPKVTPAVAADNAQDSQRIQARIGGPQPVGQRSDPYQSVPIPGVTDVELDIEQNFTTQNTAQGLATGEFTGEWQVRDSDTNEVLYTFRGVGNNQGDANRVAARWLQQNAPRDADMTDVTVVPVMR
jgi:hypothetical protein